jgi:hypothetical protein
MLRLVGVRPLLRALMPRVHISRVYASTTPTPASSQDTLANIIADIEGRGSSAPKVDKVPKFVKREEEEASEEQDTYQPPPRKVPTLEERFFPTIGTTTEAHDKYYEWFPGMRYSVNIEKLEKRQQFEQVYMANLASEPKKVIKFSNLVKKNYRTLTRSWPMVRLNSFKYGSDHFVDEMYDEIKGKYPFLYFFKY